MRRDGFTLVEALIVISILTMMTSFLVLHNRTTELQVVLIKEKASLIDTLLRAKNLASGVLIEEASGVVVCGYGIYFDKDNYFIYRDLAVDCRASDNSYSGDVSGEKLVDETVQMPAGVKLSQMGVADILFVPPLPDIFFDGQKAIGEAVIVLADDDGQTEIRVVVNGAGQISGK